MKLFAPSALALAVIGWLMALYIGNVLLSGTTLAERSCQTSCIQTLFFSGFGVGALALILAGVAVSKAASMRWLSYGGLVLALPLFAIYAGIVVIGNLAA